MKDLLSVIIPNYNKENYIRQCLDSVLNQSYPWIEMVVVDDCSNDGSTLIIKQYAQKYNQIHPIFLKKNQGVSHARNVGIDNASGTYITTLDSDDFYWNKQKLENEMRQIMEHGGNAIAYSYRMVVDSQGTLLKNGRLDEYRYVSGNLFFHFLTEKNACSYVQRDMCMPKSVVIAAGKYNEGESYYEDYDFMLRLSEKLPFYYTGEDGTAYRIMNGLAASQKKNDAMQFRVPQKIRLRYINRLQLTPRVLAYILWSVESIRLEIRIFGRFMLRKIRRLRSN